jgi:hypothetical protein
VRQLTLKNQDRDANIKQSRDKIARRIHASKRCPSRGAIDLGDAELEGRLLLRFGQNLRKHLHEVFADILFTISPFREGVREDEGKIMREKMNADFDSRRHHNRWDGRSLPAHADNLVLSDVNDGPVDDPDAAIRVRD